MYHNGSDSDWSISCKFFHCLTLLASTIYLGDILTWIILLYYECNQVFDHSYLWLLILCIIHLLQSPLIMTALNLFSLKRPSNSLVTYNNSSFSQWTAWAKTYILSFKYMIKSFIYQPLYPLIYHPFIYSLIVNNNINNDNNVNPPSCSSSSVFFLQYNYNNYYDKYHYAEFWKLFALNNIFALIRSLFLICFYDKTNSIQNNYIWCLSLFFTLCSVISLLGILSKLISLNNITFLFRWLCFTAFYFGYIISFRWISYLNDDSTHFLMVQMMKFMFIKIFVFSAPFAIWLGFRKLYLNYIYYHNSNHINNNNSNKMFLLNIIQCIISMIFYCFVWECCSFLFYIIGVYPKHYKNIPFWTVALKWISPFISDSNIVFRIIAFNYYILSKLSELNKKEIDSNHGHDIWIISKYLCKNAKRCNNYYRLVTFKGLRECLSFSLIDLILWHYNSSSNNNLFIVNDTHTTFTFLHLWLQKSFFITFLFHLFSMFLTICIPFLFLWFLSSIYNQTNNKQQQIQHCSINISKYSINKYLQKLCCVFSEWKFESILTVIFNCNICAIFIFVPYVLKFKYLIAHFYSPTNLQQSIDETSLVGMMEDVQDYYQQIMFFPIRDELLKNKFGADICQIILKYLPTLHDIFYVQ